MSLDTNAKKASYSIAVMVARQVLAQFGDIEQSAFLQGIQDVFAGKLALSEEALSDVLRAVQSQLREHQKHLIDDLAKRNLETSDRFLISNKMQPSVITLGSGLQYKVIKQGANSGRFPTVFDRVSLRYKCSLPNGRVVAASREGQPYLASLSQLLPGWSAAVKLMQEGDEWVVYVPYYLAYGEMGSPKAGIEPNTNLTIEVELLKIIEDEEGREEG